MAKQREAPDTGGGPSTDSQPLADRWIHKLRDHPLVAAVIVIAVILVGAAQTTDAVSKLWGLISGKSSVDGVWQYELHSTVSGNRIPGRLSLTQAGDLVSGVMDNPDPERPGEKSPVQGNIVNDTLILRRDTNRNGIVQEYRLRRKGEMYLGDYTNIGQTPGTHFADQGEFRLNR